MKKLLIACLLVLGIVGFIGFPVSSAHADIMDPLHGFCNGSPCIDNGTNTPLGNSSEFGFSISPGSQTGAFFLDILVPNNYSIPASFSITGSQGGAANNQPISTTASLFSVTAWTSGQLDTYLEISASPTNPIGAFLPTTQALDPGATGFFVFQADLGTAKIWKNPNETKRTHLQLDQRSEC